jgi:hypothetical protein
MLLVIALDTCVGAIPVLGDVFDVAYKANRRNLEILEPYLGATPQKPRFTDYLVVGAAFLLLVLSIVLPVVIALHVLASIFGAN